MQDSQGYARRVLDGTPMPVVVAHSHNISASAVSHSIGVVVAAILFFWHKYKPVKAEQVENKRPLGLE